MTVLITLTTAGSSTGPFNLYSDLDGFSVPFETGVSKAALVAGYTSTLVPYGTSYIRVVSFGTCNVQTDILIGDNPSTTTTTSTSSTSTTTTTSSTTTTTTTTEPPIAYNYYTFTPCAGGGSVDYRSILALQLGDVYAFQASPPDRACYTITDINAAPNTNDLPAIYGPKALGCLDDDCQQL